MLIFWSLAITAGLLVLVYLMILGVPRSTSATGEAGSMGGAPRTGLPMLGAFSTGAGLAGYLTMGLAGMTRSGRSGIVVGVALLSAAAARWLVIKAFTEPPPDPEDDPRYRYQGHVGRVTQAIARGQPGRLVFEADGRHFDLAAQSIDGTPVPKDVDVVIERIDDELATVELWTTVEERL
ncbi:MAG: hypothetical protein ACREN3_00300 [Gemmatimonadaceae bacterium]